MNKEHGMLVLLWSACLIGLADSTPTACDDGWMAFQGYCYRFGHEKVRFTEAEQYCRQHGSHLIELNNTLENDFVKDRLRDFQRECFWIGITDELVEGHWVWYTSNVAANFTEWDPRDIWHTGADCAGFWQGFDYKWADIVCTYDCSAVCKQKGANFEGTQEIVG